MRAVRKKMLDQQTIRLLWRPFPGSLSSSQANGCSTSKRCPRSPLRSCADQNTVAVLAFDSRVCSSDRRSPPESRRTWPVASAWPPRRTGWQRVLATSASVAFASSWCRSRTQNPKPCASSRSRANPDSMSAKAGRDSSAKAGGICVAYCCSARRIVSENGAPPPIASVPAMSVSPGTFFKSWCPFRSAPSLGHHAHRVLLRCRHEPVLGTYASKLSCFAPRPEQDAETAKDARHGIRTSQSSPS